MVEPLAMVRLTRLVAEPSVRALGDVTIMRSVAVLSLVPVLLAYVYV